MTGLILRPADVAAGERWTLDLDVAERAKLARPRDIRQTISAMVEEGILNDSNVAPTTATSAPLYQTRVSAVPVGTMGGTKDVTEYLLNDDAALLVLLRLRTPEALAATADLVNGIREREAAMRASAEEKIAALLVAAREEGRREALALSAADVRAIVRDELAAAPKRKALKASRSQARNARAQCRPHEARADWPEKIRAFLATVPVGTTLNTTDILRGACGIEAPDWGDLSFCGLVAHGCPGFRKLRKHALGGKITTYTRTA